MKLPVYYHEFRIVIENPRQASEELILASINSGLAGLGARIALHQLLSREKVPVENLEGPNEVK